VLRKSFIRWSYFIICVSGDQDKIEPGFCSAQSDICGYSGVAVFGDSEYLLFVWSGISVKRCCIQFYVDDYVYAKSADYNFGFVDDFGDCFVYGCGA